MNSKFVIMLASRMASSRLPGKAMMKIGAIPMYNFLYNRILPLKEKNIEVVLATTVSPSDDLLSDHAINNKINVYRGNENDLVSRAIGVGLKFNASYLIRVTGDCPFVDAYLIEKCISQYIDFGFPDVLSTKGVMPIGYDCEIINFNALIFINNLRLTSDEREHLTLHFYNHQNKFNVKKIHSKNRKLSNYRYTVDTIDDYNFALECYNKLDTLENELHSFI